MVSHSGPLNQNAFVVRDIEEAVRFWTGTIGVGPFFKFPELKFEEGEIHGRKLIPKFKAAVAFSGDLMIELIEPDGPSIFQEFLDAGGKGVHHNCVRANDYDAAVAELHGKGGITLQYQSLGGSRMSYVEVPGPTPVIIEVAELSEATMGMFAMVREAGRNWDGKTPYLQFG